MIDSAQISRSARIRAFVRQQGPNIALEGLVNFLGPYLIYVYAKPHLGDVRALMASSAPPIIWSLVEFARHRRIDAVSMLVLGGIALSLLAFLGGGGARFLQLREKLVTAIIGLIFLGSAAIGRPLIYQLARAGIARRSPGELKDFEDLRGNVFFRRVMMVMTVVWGAGLTVDAAISCVLVFVLSIPRYLLIGPIIGYATMGSLGLWTWWYSRRARRLGEARRLAQAATTSSETK
jgi:hypothetical protein